MARHFSLRPLVLLATCCLLFGGATATHAQAVRYETGRRLRLFENAWQQTTDAAARQRAIEPLKQSVSAFLGGNQLAAARSLDAARFALRSAEALPGNIRWAESLALALDRRLDSGGKSISFTAAEFYPSQVDMPRNVTLHVTVLDEQGQSLFESAYPLQQLPVAEAVPSDKLGEGDFRLSFSIEAGSETLTAGEYRFSLIDRLDDRLAALDRATTDFNEDSQNLDKLSARALVVQLTALANGEVAETDLPAARLLAEVEAAVAAVQSGRSFYGPKKTGQFWLRLPSPRQAVPVRLFVPQEASDGRPRPLVIALHGAGGSENLFFDGYGQGALVDECRRRGWLMVSPRSAGFQLFPIEELIAALEKAYPIDRHQVFLVGHSMGAMQATAAAQATPELFAAVAALGGGGVAKASPELKRLPYFVAAGSEDFALSGARRLKKNLQEAGVETLEYREYPDVEHLLIVVEALPEVCRFFAAAAADKNP